jgi:hypothetical protein
MTYGDTLPEAVRHDRAVRPKHSRPVSHPTGIPGTGDPRGAYWACPNMHPPVQTLVSQPYCLVCDAQMYEIDEGTYREFTAQ